MAPCSTSWIRGLVCSSLELARQLERRNRILSVVIAVDYLPLCIASTYVIIGTMMSMASTEVAERMVPDDCVIMMEC
jgi:hypothetical protein